MIIIMMFTTKHCLCKYGQISNFQHLLSEYSNTSCIMFLTKIYTNLIFCLAEIFSMSFSTHTVTVIAYYSWYYMYLSQASQTTMLSSKVLWLLPLTKKEVFSVQMNTRWTVLTKMMELYMKAWLSWSHTKPQYTSK